MTCEKSPYRKYTEHFADGTTKDITEEIPFEIPENWAWCNLEQICEFITDGTHQTPKYSESGYIFLSSKNVTTGKINWEDVKYVGEELHNILYKRIAPKLDDILLAKNGTTGIAAIVDRDIIFDIYVSLAILRPFNKYINSKYLLHIINSSTTKSQFDKGLKGIGVPNLHLEQIRKVLIPLPPLSEQKRIVAKVEELLALVEDLETNKTDLKSTIQQTKAKVLDMAIRGELVPQNPDDEPASVLLERIKNEQQSAKSKKKNTAHNTHYDNDKLLMVNDEFPFEIPENWAWCRLGEIGEVISGGTPQTSNENYWNGDVSWITPADLSNYKEKYISRGKRNISMEGLENSSAKIIRRGSVLFSSRAPIGYVAISEKEVSTNQGFKSISPYIENSEHYIYYFLLAEKENISMKASGTTFKELSGTEFGKIIFPLPPLAEQRRIVEKIEHIFSVLDELEENLS
ncbi:restriction endonuclease subunit S [Capnocytophaga canimorsus]|uniref:restriction endonuclease subunit S n=1 Tax=Capnocytophaga canimorsus TaxID=28188 RepID=UPI0029373DF8|nr:restriction endonuclease subunit S [Capnocytophaga canimorsus]